MKDGLPQWLWCLLILTQTTIILAMAVDTRNKTGELTAMKAEAIKRGVAEWKTGDNNLPEFAWKPEFVLKPIAEKQMISTSGEVKP